jgi:RNA polymerase sigma factor (sigma-70 family)
VHQRIRQHPCFKIVVHLITLIHPACSRANANNMKQQPGSTNLPDEFLLEMIKEDKEWAFTILYKKYWTGLVQYTCHHLDDRSLSEEVVQEFFIKLYQRDSPPQIKQSLAAYLYTSIHNRIINHLRSQANYQRHTLTAASAGGSANNNVEQFIDLMDARKGVERRLLHMNPKYREVYLMSKEQGYSIRQIAEALDRPSSTVEKQLCKALILLRKSLKKGASV